MTEFEIKRMCRYFVDATTYLHGLVWEKKDLWELYDMVKKEPKALSWIKHSVLEMKEVLGEKFACIANGEQTSMHD